MIFTMFLVLMTLPELGSRSAGQTRGGNLSTYATG
jgi:hypothetical protein